MKKVYKHWFITSNLASCILLFASCTKLGSDGFGANDAKHSELKMQGAATSMASAIQTMKGVPAVVTSLAQGNNSIYAFIRSNNDQLKACFYNTRNSSWEWGDLGAPANARLNSSPAVVALDLNIPPISRIHAFIHGNNARLYERYWDGTRWVAWIDRGKPNVATPVLSPSVVGLPSQSRSVLDVFSLADDGTGGNLFRYTPQFANQWFFQGATLTRANLLGEPGSIIDRNQVYTFVVGNDGNLHVVNNETTSNNPVTPQWRNLGKPSSGTLSIGRPAVSLFAPDVTNRFFTFFSSSEGQLWANVWNGKNDPTPGLWVNLGSPPGTTVKNAASVVKFRFMNKNFMYTFVQGANNHLYVFRWDGANDRLWADLGRPQTNGRSVPATPLSGNTTVTSPPGAVPFRIVEPNQTSDRMYAFVFGGDSHLHVCYWNGVDKWLWVDLGTF